MSDRDTRLTALLVELTGENFGGMCTRLQDWEFDALESFLLLMPKSEWSAMSRSSVTAGKRANIRKILAAFPAIRSAIEEARWMNGPSRRDPFEFLLVHDFAKPRGP